MPIRNPIGGGLDEDRREDRARLSLRNAGFVPLAAGSQGERLDGATLAAVSPPAKTSWRQRLYALARRFAPRDKAPVIVRRIDPKDLKNALEKGIDDFVAKPSHVVFLGLIYPIIMIFLYAVTFTSNALPLLYPLASGFALIGPFAAIGLYSVSQQRELGEKASWRHALDVLRSPSIPSVLALGLVLAAIFLCWLVTAQALYEWLFGPSAPESYPQFLDEILTTSRGWTLIALGNVIGLAFAVLVLSISVVSFPLLLDRDVGAVAAVRASVRAVLANPVTMALWGLMVAALLLIGSLPLFVGLAVVMPILGHSSWHLYRRVVEPPLTRKSPRQTP